MWNRRREAGRGVGDVGGLRREPRGDEVFFGVGEALEA